MSTVATAWTVIVIVGLLTFAIRGSFLLTAGRLERLPRWVLDLMRLIPSAALAALVAPAILRAEGELALLGPRTYAGLLALGVALLTRSVLATIGVGLVAVVGLELLLG
ncbi:MAG: AzlD domain-containing protein [Actinomycetota bacterium]